MHHLALAKEFDGLSDVRVVNKTQNVVVRSASFLLCRKVFVEVGYDVALDAYIFHVKWHTCGGDGVDACGVVDKVVGEGGFCCWIFL